MVDTEELLLVRNKPEFWDFILELRNEFREWFSGSEEISQETHYEFMKNHGDTYYICLHGSTPVGFIGEIEGDIRLATSTEFQGQGIGTFMIEKLVSMKPDAYACVKIDNEPSQATFRSADFEITHVIMKRIDEERI